MPLHYQDDGYLYDLAPVMDELAGWYGRIMRLACYPEEQTHVAVPESFPAWLQLIEGKDDVDRGALKRLYKLYQDMLARAETFVVSAHQDGQPPVALFDGFTDLYDELVLMLRRFERDSLLEDSGIDIVTGLRSRRVMMNDLGREMERRARHGKPFSLALVTIDRYEAIHGTQSAEDNVQMLRDLAYLIRKCLRSFDDAYRVGDGEFIMSLKHADISGGTAALGRLRRLLEENPVMAGAVKMTLSGCVAEPLPGDDLANLLENMRQDLSRYDREAGTALEYHEVSPLQRFVETIHD